MAVYRNISLSFWTDIKVVDDFTPEDKYFMLYCLTNPHTNIIGCYEISIKQMSTEMGYTTESVEAILKRFNEKHKIVVYDKTTKELFIKNWHKYNWTKSPKVLPPIISNFNQIKSVKLRCLVGQIINEMFGDDTVSIGYQYPMDTTDTDTDTVTDTITDIKIEKKKISKKFVKPTVEEIKDYCFERNNNVDAERFYDFYECKGWLVGKNPMKDWKAAVRNWERSNNSTYQQPQQQKNTVTRLQEMIERGVFDE